MTLPASGQKWLDTLESMRASIAELAAERDRYRDALVARHGGEPLALLSELDAARAERDAARQELNELDIYLRCQGTQGDSALDRAKRIVANTSLPGYVRLVEERDAAVAKCAELERMLGVLRSDLESTKAIAAAEQGGA